nr:uncharacterized protein LOC110001602 isoform X2 [Labrus bergylta]
MKVRHTLIFFVFISTTLENGDACLTERDILNHTATEGGNFKIKCYFDNPDERKIFCRDDCREEDILVETSGVRAQRGRYSIGYNEEHVGMSIMPLYVSIKHLTKADSGRYSCVFGNLQSPSDTQVMELRVEGAPTTSEPSQTIQPLSTSAPPASTLTTTLEKLATPAAARGDKPRSSAECAAGSDPHDHRFISSCADSLQEDQKTSRISCGTRGC